MALWSIFIFFLAPFCLGQQQRPSTTLGAPAATHTIGVGDGDHKFRPETVQAAVGDIVEFRFYPQNHSVVRAEYEYPCIPYEMVRPNQTGFYTGFHPVDSFLPDPPKYQIRINDTSPIFFYCSTPNSCTKYAMVGAINPNSSTPLSRQKDIARKSSFSLSPGEPFPKEEEDAPTPTPPPATPSPVKAESKGLSGGAIAGIVIGVLVVVALLGVLVFYIRRSRTMKQEITRRNCTVKHTAPHSPPNMLQYDPSSTLARDYFQKCYPASPLDLGHPQPTKRTSVSSTARLNRRVSNRSVGGTFDLSPTTGYYTRTHNGQDTYKYGAPDPADAESPTLGREMEANPPAFWHRGDGGEGGYSKDVSWGIGNAALNEGHPAEMDGGSVDIRPQ